MAIESYGHVDYTSFIHFEKSQKMKAVKNICDIVFRNKGGVLYIGSVNCPIFLKMDNLTLA